MHAIAFRRFPQLELSLDDIKWAIVAAKKVKVKQEVSSAINQTFESTNDLSQTITVLARRDRLRIYVDGADKYYRLRELKRLLPEVVVKVRQTCSILTDKLRTATLQGVPTIRRAIINIKEKDDTRGKKGDKELLVEGYGLQKVMTTLGTTTK